MTPMEKELLTRIDERVEAILEQVKKTNGRVTELQTWRSQIKGMTTALFYVFGTAGAIATLVIGILELTKK